VPLATGLIAIVAGFKAWTLAVQMWSAVTKVATAIQWLMNAAMTANPIGIIVVAIAALVAAFVLLYTKVDWFRAGVDAMVDGVVAAFQWLWDMIQKVYHWIADNWPLLLAILTGPIGIAVKLIVDNWDAIKNGFQAAWDWIKQIMTTVYEVLTAPYRLAWDKIKAIIDGIPGAFTAAVSGITNALSNVWSTISDPFKKGWDLAKSAGSTVMDWLTGLGTKINNAWSGLADIIKYPFTTAFNAIKSLWNSTVGGFGFTVPDWVPGVGGKGFKIPRMAAGGIVTRPTIALIGEAGPEAVVPLGSSTGFGNVTINVYALTANAEVGRKVYEALQEYSRISGNQLGAA
jgi:phage-related protein